MSELKISSLLSLTLLTSPLALHSTTLSPSLPPKSETAIERTQSRKMRHLLAGPATLQPMGTYVGELQEKWQFPSDHLPIGMTLDGAHFGSWNVLNIKYMDFVTIKNTQGLSRSQIAQEHVFIGDSQLTIRDQHVVDLILQMINHPTHPKGILSLQECGPDFLSELKSRLPSNYRVFADEQEAIVVDENQFEVIDIKAISNVFSEKPLRTFQDVTLRNKQTGKLYRMINAHLPGDPTKPAADEFATYLAKTFDPSITTIAMGDMNFNEIEIGDAISKAFPDPSERFAVYAPYPSCISHYPYYSKAIDHFIVFPAEGTPLLHDPEMMIEGLSSVANYL